MYGSRLCMAVVSLYLCLFAFLFAHLMILSFVDILRRKMPVLPLNEQQLSYFWPFEFFDSSNISRLNTEAYFFRYFEHFFLNLLIAAVSSKNNQSGYCKTELMSF